MPIRNFFFLVMISMGNAAMAADLQQSWLKLLHYHRTWDGKYKSEIDGKNFYLSAQGRTDPQAELNASIAAFQNSQNNKQPDNQSIECRFPARFLLLKRELVQAARWTQPDCSNLKTFTKGLHAHSVTLVFSSYYLNNPASAFGHTFLRFNKNQHSGEHFELLDYGVGYAATTGNADPLSFALGGLFGWFRGDFTSVPYYLKVQEYNNFESRDLWEYELNLNLDEVELLVLHIWELASSEIHYQYLTSNCASMMLTTLEAAAPRLNLWGRLPYWIIPADTIGVLYQEPGLVRQYHFRASKRTQFLDRYKNLKSDQQLQVQKLARLQGSAADLLLLKSQPSAAELDAYIDYLDYRYFKKIVLADPQITDLKQAALIARSHLAAVNTDHFDVPEPKNETPQTAHSSARASAGLLWSHFGERSYLLGQRFALHDLLDPQQGYPSDAEIDFLDFKLRVQDQQSQISHSSSFIKIENIYAFAVQSLAPYQPMMPNLSWKVRVGAERTWDQSCTECVAEVFGGGLGWTWDTLSNHTLMTTLLADADVSYSSEFQNSIAKIRLGPELNLRYILNSNFVAQASANYLHLFLVNPMDAFRYVQEIRYSPVKNWALGASAAQWSGGDAEYKTQIYYYY